MTAARSALSAAIARTATVFNTKLASGRDKSATLRRYLFKFLESIPVDEAEAVDGLRTLMVEVTSTATKISPELASARGSVRPRSLYS